tara:strand:+ start:3488 stop:3847 length:360 start_codon:yes stop_codon:yes gene_type:complete
MIQKKLNKEKELIPNLFASFKSEPDKYEYKLNKLIDITVYTSKDKFEIINSKSEKKEKVKSIMLFGINNIEDGEITYHVNTYQLFQTKDQVEMIIKMIRNKEKELQKQLKDYDTNGKSN